jgi:hypothetical protein
LFPTNPTAPRAGPANILNQWSQRRGPHCIFISSKILISFFLFHKIFYFFDSLVQNKICQLPSFDISLLLLKEINTQ